MRNTAFKGAIDRNNGLIAISEKGISNTQFLEEARVEIHLDTKNIKLNLYYDIEENFIYDDDMPEVL